MTKSITAWIRTYHDFPKPGVLFYDLCPLLACAEGLQVAIASLNTVIDEWQPDILVAIESRGFLLGAPLAFKRNIGVLLARKPGKLPGELLTQEYALEYGQAQMTLQKSETLLNKRVVIVDDLLATGGTLQATEMLVERAGAKVVGAAVLIELMDMLGRQKLNCPVRAVQACETHQKIEAD